MFAFQCPTCGNTNNLSLAEPSCEAPLRCWKCKGLWIVKIEDEKLTSCEPLSEEALEQYAE